MGDVIDFEAYREQRRRRQEAPGKAAPRRAPGQGRIPDFAPGGASSGGEPAPSLPKPRANPCAPKDRPAD